MPSVWIIVDTGHAEHRNATGVRHGFIQQLQALPEYLSGDHGEAGEITARVRQSLREAEADCVTDNGHNDRGRPGDCPQGTNRRLAVGNDDIGRERDDFGRKGWEPLVVAVAGSYLQTDVSTLEIAQFAKTVAQGGNVYLGAAWAQHGDKWQL